MFGWSTCLRISISFCSPTLSSSVSFLLWIYEIKWVYQKLFKCLKRWQTRECSLSHSLWSNELRRLRGGIQLIDQFSWDREHSWCTYLEMTLIPTRSPVVLDLPFLTVAKLPLPNAYLYCYTLFNEFLIEDRIQMDLLANDALDLIISSYSGYSG